MRQYAFILGVLFLVVAARGSGQDKKELVKLTAEDLVAMETNAISEADAKKRWEGQTVEFTATSWNNHQDQKEGPHAGQTLFGITIKGAGDGKNASFLLATFFNNAKDSNMLKARKITDKTPFKLRGKVVIDYELTWRVWLDDAELVKD
jgi:hypothetical protein